MGKRSIKENKTVYQLSREDAGFTRAQASEALEFISESRIEKIEGEKTLPQPDEILAMAKAYKKSSLCNYYCSHECPIGKEYVPEVKSGSLAEIILELIAGINSVNKTKDRLIEITADGIIDDSEITDFAQVQNQLGNLSLTVDALNLWVNETIDSGMIDKDKLAEVKEKMSRE